MAVASPKPGRDVGLRLIVAYKVAKAVLEIAFGVALVVFATKATDELRSIAIDVRDHGTAAWSVSLADRVVRAATRRHLFVVAVASLLDGVVTAIEGWALHRRYRWAPWLVIGLTSCLLPFEVFALVRHVTAGRATLLLVNAAIVVYLLRREHRER